jgi:helicase
MTDAGGEAPATVDDLDIPQEIKDILLEQGISELYPPQRDGLVHALAGNSLVLAIPTASGKTLVALLGALKAALAGGRALYIVPLKALAGEKFEDFSAFERLGIKVGMSIGDYDDLSRELKDCDIVIATSEKADSLSRHDLTWIEHLSVVVADEVHLMHDPSRGPTLEVLLARIRTINPRCQVIALSATIQNSEEIAEWLDAEHVTSDFRPVELKEGVFLDGDVLYTDNSKEEFPYLDNGVVSVVAVSLKKGEQSLVFVNTRKSTEALAERLRNYLEKALSDEERALLAELAKRLKRVDAEVTGVGDRLAGCIAGGAAFHHAGLSPAQRRLVEGAFKDKALRCIVATPTLAAGINLPAKRVIVRDVRRFDSMYGNVPIPVLEIKQMLGRAGRPRYDTVGQAILVAKDEGQQRDLFERYLWADPERIYSKLGTEAALRSHVLASIATGLVADDDDLDRFVQSTFYAHQADTWTLKERLDGALDFLEEEELVVREGTRIWPTKFGRRVSDLYIDPLSAVLLRQSVERAAEEGSATPIAWLQAVCATPDVPTFFLRRSDYSQVPDVAERHRDEFLVEDVEEEMAREDFLAEVKTASMFVDWISEVTEDGITVKYAIGPGDIRAKVDNGRWLIYATAEIARLLGHSDMGKELRRLEQQVRYGVREELLPLVALRGVGRRRARALHAKGLRKPAHLREATIETIAAVPGIGPTLARRVKEQLDPEWERGPAKRLEESLYEEPMDAAEPETLISEGNDGADTAETPSQITLSSFIDKGGDDDD